MRCGGAESSGSNKNSSGGIPPWKRYQKKKGIGKQAEATLEMMWSRTEWLSEEQILGMWDMHRVRRELVIDWFAKKRKERRSRKNKEKVEDEDILFLVEEDGDEEEEQLS